MFSCNVVSCWAQLVSFFNRLQDVKLSRIAIYRDEFRRMYCSINWSFISCGELHCDSVKILINPCLFFLRQCESLDWSDCLVVLLLSATHFWKSSHARLIRGCFSFSQCFRAGVFSSLSPLPPHSLWLVPFPPLFGKFQHGDFVSKLHAQRKGLHCRLSLKQKSYPLLNGPRTTAWKLIWQKHGICFYEGRLPGRLLNHSRS